MIKISETDVAKYCYVLDVSMVLAIVLACSVALESKERVFGILPAPLFAQANHRNPRSLLSKPHGNACYADYNRLNRAENAIGIVLRDYRPLTESIS